VMWMTADLVRVVHDLGLVVKWNGVMGNVVDSTAIKDKEKMVRIIYYNFVIHRRSTESLVYVIH
jgi:hypothetical protein